MSTVLKLTAAAVRILFFCMTATHVNFAFVFKDPPLSALMHPRLCNHVGPSQRYTPISDLSVFLPFASDIFRSRPHSGSLFEGTQVVQGPSRRKSPPYVRLIRAHLDVCG